MFYSFWRPSTLAPGALAPLTPLAKPLPSMMLQELPPWLNLCMLFRLGGVLPGLLTGHASTVSSVEHGEWGTSLVRPQKLQSWLVTLKMACWLPLLHVQPTFYDQFSTFNRPTIWVASTTSRLYLAG